MQRFVYNDDRMQ